VAYRDEKFWAAFRNQASISASSFLKDARSRPAGPGPMFLRPREDDDDSPLPEPDEETPPDDPCGGFPFVRLPLIAAQFHLALGPEPIDCPRPGQLDRIAAFAQSLFARVAPNAFVKITCVPPILSIGIWPPLGGNPACELQSRQRALERLDLLERGENVGFFLHASLVRSLAARGFEAAPKRYSGNGGAQPSGPVHLTGLSVEFRDPDTVVTRITGFDDRPTPDVGFTLIVTDQIVSNVGLLVALSDRVVDKDDSDIWKAVLTVFTTGVAFTDLAPIALWVLPGDIRAAISSPDGDGVAGVGERVLRLVPQEIPLPGQPEPIVVNPLVPVPGGGPLPMPEPNPTKLSISYRRVAVTDGGLFFGGFAVQDPRTARASLRGPARVEIPERARSVPATYEVTTADTFGALTFTWQPAAGITVARPNSRRTVITFARGSHAPGSAPFRRTVRVRVTDQDGFAKELSQTVEISLPGPEDA
jgi:hypothetical protein